MLCIETANKWRPAAHGALEGTTLSPAQWLAPTGLTFAKVHFDSRIKPSPEPVVDNGAFKLVRDNVYRGPARADVPAPKAEEALVRWFGCLTEGEKFLVFAGAHGRHSTSFPRHTGVLLFLLISLLTVVAAPRDAEDMVEWLRQMIEGEHRRRQHAREQEVMRGQESKDDSHSVKKRLRS